MSEVRRIRIAIADDHQMFRDGLRRLLESERAFDVVGEAGDGLEARQIVESVKPDVLLLDVAMPRMGGLEALAGLTAAPTKIVLLTAGLDPTELLRAIQFGARGVVLKQAASRLLIEAVYAVMGGKYVIPGATLADADQAVRRVGRPPRPFGLTSRELEIVAAIVAGVSNREIAARFTIAVPTVKHHLRNIFDKTGASSRLELATFAIQKGLVRPE
jgi:DNA-binding NarL/FixJ family response regulator